MLSHPHASRTGLKLLLVQHAVHFTGLVAGRGGARPADHREKRNVQTAFRLVKQGVRNGDDKVKSDL